MELLPIIYVSLAIFTVVAIATIITSFISYKVRAKAEGYQKPYEKEEDPSNRNYMKKKVMDSDGRFHTVVEGAEKSKKQSSSKSSSHGKKRSEIRKESHSRKESTRSKESRIKIINKPVSAPSPEEKKMHEKDKTDRKNVNENILNKYTDDKGEEFYSPKISGKKKGEKK